MLLKIRRHGDGLLSQEFEYFVDYRVDDCCFEKFHLFLNDKQNKVTSLGVNVELCADAAAFEFCFYSTFLFWLLDVKCFYSIHKSKKTLI